MATTIYIHPATGASSMPLREKPAYGQPCNACGLCCMMEPCPLGQYLFKTARGPCPALVIEDGKSACGVALHPQKYAPTRARIAGVGRLRDAAAKLNGFGTGCDMALGDEEVAESDRQRLREIARGMLPDEDRAFKVWGITHRQAAGLL